MPGHDIIHPIADRWGRYQNWDFCSETEPTETWSYMTWINPSTQVLQVRNKENTGWITIGGGGGGGPHGPTHEDGGTDEISAAGLSGVLADKQDANKLQGRAVVSDAPSDGQVLIWDDTGEHWEPGAVPKRWPYAKVIVADILDPDADYDNLADALAAAGLGDVIELGPNSSDYHLPDGNLDKSVVIRGQGPPGPTIDSVTRLHIGGGSTTLWDWFVFENLFIWGEVNIYRYCVFENCVIDLSGTENPFFTVSTNPQTAGRIAFRNCRFVGAGALGSMTNSFGKVEFYDCRCELNGASTLNHGTNQLIVRDFGWGTYLTISGSGTRTNFGKPIVQADVDANKGTPIFDGQLYYATDTDKLYVGDGGSWVEAGGGGGGDIWVDRGDPTDWDWKTADFTKDDDWHVLDLSGIVDVGTVLVKFRVYINDNVATKSSMWRENGNVNNYNLQQVKTFAVGVSFEDEIDVTCDENLKVQYRISAGTQTIYALIRGWWKPA